MFGGRRGKEIVNPLGWCAMKMPAELIKIEAADQLHIRDGGRRKVHVLFDSMVALYRFTEHDHEFRFYDAIHQHAE